MLAVDALDAFIQQLFLSGGLLESQCHTEHTFDVLCGPVLHTLKADGSQRLNEIGRKCMCLCKRQANTFREHMQSMAMQHVMLRAAVTDFVRDGIKLHLRRLFLPARTHTRLIFYPTPAASVNHGVHATFVDKYTDDEHRVVQLDTFAMFDRTTPEQKHIFRYQRKNAGTGCTKRLSDADMALAVEAVISTFLSPTPVSRFSEAVAEKQKMC
jgi:hypothetical protein